MSEQHKTPQEYTERYAAQYCHGDVEVAAGHKIVKEVYEELKGDTDEKESRRSAD